jgi:hypothetical protein
VRLIDFNPVRGTTSALLFDWDELAYPPHPSDSNGHPQPPPLANGAPFHASVNSAPFYADANGAPLHTSSNGVLDCTNGQVGREEGLLGRAVDEFEFRIVESEGNAIQPNLAACSVPYDMVDMSEGGAIDALLQQLQAAELEQGEE